MIKCILVYEYFEGTHLRKESINNNISNNPNHKTAFTLAEVLITLAIIGVVAAITIPSLNNNINKQDTVTKVKKAYSTLSQATQEINAECGGNLTNCLVTMSTTDQDATSRQEVVTLYKPKLLTNKECPTSATLGCFANTEYKFLNNSNMGNFATANIFDNARFSLNDGTAVLFDWDGTSTDLFRFAIDTNGPKPPNQLGKDLFMFYYNPNSRILKSFDTSSCTTSDYGWGCTGKILQDGEINYY